jgi:phage terminase large subunit-like protein
MSSLIITPDEIEEEYYRRFLDYIPNKKQELFHIAGLTAQERYMKGGNRSGKTHCALREYSKHLTGIYNDSWRGYKFDRPLRCWMAGLTSSLIAETIQKDLIGDKEQNLRGIIHPSLIREKRKSGNSDMYRTIYINHISGGSSKITFKTYEEGREAFQGSKIDLALLDEEPPKKIYEECKMRTMSTDEKSRGMIVVCATPLKGFTDFYNYFTQDRYPEEVRDSRWYADIRWEDANHLSLEEKKRMIAGMSPHEIEARTNGLAWPGSGLVYPIPESMIICDPFEIPKHWARVYSIDFGWLHPAFLFAAHDRDNDKLYYYSEYSVPERTPAQHAYALQGQGIDWMPGVYDPAGKSSQQGDGKKLVDLYRQAGFKNLYPANNSKEEGILKLLQRFQADKGKIFSTLTKFRSEITKYCRDEDGIPIKKDDHFCDDARYIEMSGLSVAIPKNFRLQNNGIYGGKAPGYY